MLEDLDAGDAHLGGVARGVGVGKGQARVGNAGGGGQGAVAVVVHGHGKGDGLSHGRDALICQAVGLLVCHVRHGPVVAVAGGVAIGHELGQGLGVVVQGPQRHRAVGRVGCGQDVAVAAGQVDHKGELAHGHIAAGQGLSGANLGSRAARDVGRGEVAVVEGHDGLLAAGGASLVGKDLRALGAAGDRGGRRQGGSRGVVGHGDGHGAHGRVVGVAVGGGVALDHLIGVGLAGICLREVHVMAGQDVDGRLGSVGCGGHRDRVARKVDTQGVGGGLVVGRDGNLELAAHHRAAGQGLGHREAARSGVAHGRAVGVGEDRAGHGRGGNELALAVVGHVHGNGGDVVVVRDAGETTRGLGDLVLIGAGCGVGHRPKGEGRAAVNGIGVGDGDGGGLGHRGACGLGLEVKGEGVAVDPVAARDDLLEVRRGSDGLGLVLVGEGRGAGRGDELRGGDELALKVVGHGDLELGDVGVVGHAARGAGDLGDLVLVLARGFVGDGAKVESASLGGSRDVGLGHRGALGHGLELELEAVAVLPLAARQLLGQEEFSRVERCVGSRVLIGESRGAGRGDELRGGDELALKVVGHGDFDGRRVSVVGDARNLVRIGGNNLGHSVLEHLGAVRRVGNHILGERDGSKAEVRGVILGHGHLGHNVAPRVLRQRGPGGLRLNGERESVARQPIAPDQHLVQTRVGRVVGSVRGLIGVLESDSPGIDRGLCRELAGMVAVLVNVGNLHGERRNVVRIGHACDRLAGIRFLDLVLVRTDLGVRDASERDGRMSILCGHIILGHGNGGDASLRALRHRGAVGQRLQLKGERIVFRPVATDELLVHTQIGHRIVGNWLGGVRVGEARRGGLTGHEGAGSGHSLTVGTGGRGLREANGHLGLGNRISPTGAQAAHLQGLVRLDGVGRLAAGVEGQVELIARRLPVRIEHHGRERIARRLGDVELKRELGVGVVLRVIPVRHGDGLGNLQRRRLVEHELAVVAQVRGYGRRFGNGSLAVPLGVQHVGCSAGVIGGIALLVLLLFVKLVDID